MEFTSPTSYRGYTIFSGKWKFFGMDQMKKNNSKPTYTSNEKARLSSFIVFFNFIFYNRKQYYNVINDILIYYEDIILYYMYLIL